MDGTLAPPSQPAPNTKPPAYSPAQPDRPYRSIQDLRAQIIANGSVIRSRNDANKSSDDHIELIVAKTPAPGRAASSRGRDSRTHGSEKEAYAALNRASDPMRTGWGLRSSGGGGGERGGERGGPSGGEGGKHYAVLMKWNGERQTIHVIVQGEPRDTVEAALEWMLERTEMLMHDLVVTRGRPDSGDTCVVM